MEEFTSNTFKVMPWKNGRGVTTEIYREEVSGKMSFRLSRALIDEDGPFSNFSGYMRHLIILKGMGCLLTIDEKEMTLNTNQIIKFDGNQKVTAQLIDGPITDFNIFCDESIYQCEVCWIKGLDIKVREKAFIYSPEEDKLIILDPHETFFAQKKMILIQIKEAL